MHTNGLITAAVFCLGLLAFPTNAHAYLDAGTGSMLLQAAVASIMGAAFIAKMYWRELKARFTGKPLNETEDEPNAPPASRSDAGIERD